LKPEAIEARLEELISRPQSGDEAELQELHHGAISVMLALYGEKSSQERALAEAVNAAKTGHRGTRYAVTASIGIVRGALASMRREVSSGFLGSLRSANIGEVLTDFTKLSRHTLDEDNIDQGKNVAAVLAAAAFEDTIRRLAEKHSLPHLESLEQLLSELKNRKVLAGVQVGIAQSYLNFRNRALHAEWDKVDRASTVAVLGFVEELLRTHFV
jgi:hypothetical protein